MARATVVIRLTPKQAEIVWLNTDGWIDAGCCKDGLHPDELEALSSVRDQISQQIHKRKRRRVKPAPPAAPEAQGAWCFDMEAAPRDGYRVPVAILSWIDRKPVAGEAAFSNENQQWRWTDESYRDPIQPYAWFRMPEPPAPPASSGQESA